MQRGHRVNVVICLQLAFIPGATLFPNYYEVNQTSLEITGGKSRICASKSAHVFVRVRVRVLVLVLVLFFLCACALVRARVSACALPRPHGHSTWCGRSWTQWHLVVLSPR